MADQLIGSCYLEMVMREPKAFHKTGKNGLSITDKVFLIALPRCFPNLVGHVQLILLVCVDLHLHQGYTLARVAGEFVYATGREGQHNLDDFFIAVNLLPHFPSDG